MLSGKRVTPSTPSTPSTTSTLLTSSTTSTSIPLLTGSTSLVSSAALTANGITYNVINSLKPNYQLPVPTAGLKQNVLQIAGNANVPEYTAYYDKTESQIIYVSAISPGGITALWDVTNLSQIAMTNQGQYSIVIDNAGIYMSLWDWSAEISATAPNFFSLLNGASPLAPASKFRARSASKSRAHSASLKPRDLTDFQVALTVSASCSVNQIPPYLPVFDADNNETNNCTVTTTGPGQCLGACAYPLGEATCTAILGASLTSLSTLNSFSAPVSAGMKAAQILNGIEQTALAQSASLFTPYLGADLMSFMIWIGAFEAAIVGQAGEPDGAAQLMCERWGDGQATLVVSYAGGNPPPTAVYGLEAVLTTTVVASVEFPDPWVQPCQ